jgi:hypothetical protein
MNRFLALLFIALVTFAIVLLATNPDWVSEIWLYVIGLFGLIGKIFKSAANRFKNVFKDIAAKKEETKKEPVKTSLAQPLPVSNAVADTHRKLPLKAPATADDFHGLTLTLLRYTDDGETTLGMLFINDQYLCLTLEDAHHEEKVPGETRIPAGIYNITFREAESDLTKRYRERFPDWFTYHLELQGVPGFNFVYIHSGGNHRDTDGSPRDGCILVSDSLTTTDQGAYLTNSRNTFKKLYQLISQTLLNNRKVRIIIKDEVWFSQLKSA